MNTSQTLSIFKREFLGYFRSPVAYVFLVAFLVAGVALAFFVGNFFGENQASLERYFMFYPWLFLFFIPAAGMRLWSEEKRSGSIELLFTLPVTLIEAVMGKFLAAWAFLTIAIALSFPMAVTVGYLGHPDWGVVATSYLGSVLMAGSYLGICSLTSATTRNQVISFVISVLVCVVFVFLGWSVFSPLLEAVLPVALVDLLANFSFITHFEGFLRGIVDLKDVVFFLSLTGFSLFLNVVVLER
jgi:ABC-2 type transport system permease protein